MQHQNIFNILENFAPLNLALPGDNCGLQIGSAKDITESILLCVDVSKAAVKKALANKANLIISHHPIKEKNGTVAVTGSSWEILKPLVKNDITVYTGHTNFDVTAGGLNDWLSNALGLQSIKVINPTYIEKIFKLVTFVPQNTTEKVRSAICSAGAGIIGEYSDCAFLSHGIGTFTPGKKANPKVGKNRQLNRVGEARLEIAVTASKLSTAVAALLKAHPYEEPAYDIYLLKNQGNALGPGRTGTLKKPLQIKEFCQLIDKKLNPKFIYPVGKGKVKKVALCSGGGRDIIKAAIEAGADTFFTGELDHHARILARDCGLKTIEAGHFDTEVCFVEITAKILKNCGIKIIKFTLNH